MRKQCFTWGLVVVCVALWSSVALAGENTILASLTNQGVAVQKMDNVAMQNVKGTSLDNPTWGYLLDRSYSVVSRPYASLWLGIDKRGHAVHEVKYKGTGSQTDYRSYRHMGTSLSGGDYGTIALPTATPNIYQVFTVTGDEWKADMDYTKPQQWMLAGAVDMELHVICVNPNTGQQYNAPGSTVDFLGWNISYWNRPVGTFSW